MAENLWALREQKSMSVANLANRSGLPIRVIMEYEAGLTGIDPKHLGQLASALYVEKSDIKLQCDPKPRSGPLQPQPPRDARTGRRPSPDAPPKPNKQRAKEPPKPPAPARPTQITHAENLLQRLGRSRQELEAKLDRPLTELNRVEMSQLLTELDAEIPETDSVRRRRAYLPESMDEHEAHYLAAVQEAGELLHFNLFDGTSLTGQVIGFGPYNITLRQTDGAEVSVNKLAIVSYRKEPATAGSEG